MAYNIHTVKISDLSKEEKANIEYEIILTERYLRMVGTCYGALEMLRKENMFDKPAKEIKKFFHDKGRDDWNLEWVKIWHSPETYEVVKKRYFSDYYTSKFIVLDPITKVPSFFDTLEEAKKEQQNNQTKYITQFKYLFIKDDKFFDIVNNCLCDDLETAQNNYINHNLRLFQIVEEMTTFNGHVVTKPLK